MDWIPDQDEIKIKKISAYDAAIKLLCRRDYSTYKLSQKLIEKNYSELEINEAVERLIEKRYLREDFYIEARIKAFIRKNYSARYIQQKLAQEHLDVPLIDINNLFDQLQITERSQIDKLVEKKLQFLDENTSAELKTRNKIQRFLVSKGHFTSIDQ